LILVSLATGYPEVLISITGKQRPDWKLSSPRAALFSPWIKANAGSIRNTGLEVSLNIVPVQNRISLGIQASTSQL